MKYELEFIGINKETSRDADAICFRYYDESKRRYIIGVFDGGTKDHGEELKNHIIKYYFNGEQNGTIDFVICSHSDLDHASGLSVILENFIVNELYVNRPWELIDDLFEKVNDGRITKASLEERLRKTYSYVDSLEKIANEKKISIRNAFEGTEISDKLKVLSPSKEFYIDLLVESNKTPLEESITESTNSSFFSKMVNNIKMVFETWTKELLREDVKTSAENETSVILLGDMEEQQFLLTGDAGIRALKNAINYAKELDYELKQVDIQQIPHHGGRHNVSPSILDDLIGKKKEENEKTNIHAFVSVSKISDHPLKMVVNAYKRRGASVFEARKYTVRHQFNIPDREGWGPTQELEFSKEVEEWKES